MTKIKRYDHIFEKIATFDNLYTAYQLAIKGKRFKPEPLKITASLESSLLNICTDLWTDSFTPQPCHEFELRTEIKRRIVNAPSFRDCIVQHAIILQTEYMFDKKMIFDSYANRKGKGTHRAVKRLQQYLRKMPPRAYILQGDIRHYFPSISHDILKKDLERTIADPKLLNLWSKIIDSYNKTTGTGIPIGAPLSQLEAGIYLTPLDHLVKETLKEPCYLRLMDDFIIISPDKEKLAACLAAIKNFLENSRKLSLNRKTKIYPARCGVDFAGYRTWKTHILPRKRNLEAAKRRFKEMSWLYRHGKIELSDIQSRVASFAGYVKHCNACKSADSVMKRLTLTGKNERYPPTQ